MRRRDLIAGIAGSAAAWPLSLRAQPKTAPHVGVNEGTMRVRKMRDVNSEQNCISLVDGQRVVIKSGRDGTWRENEKIFDSVEAALNYAQKEEISLLRKGWILSDPNALAGQPRMHRLLPGAFTGSMAIEAIGERLLCSRPGKEAGDRLYLIESDGRVLDTIDAPPNRLIWAAKFIADTGLVLVKADHQIMSLSLEKRAFRALTTMNPHPVSFLSTSGTLAAWYAEPEIVVSDMRDGRTILRKTIPAELYHAHSPQMSAQLSADGAMLACCSHAGVITLLDVPSGEVRSTIKGDFHMIGMMAFIANDRRLIAQEVYGNWRLRCFDLDRAQEMVNMPRIELGVGGFAIDPQRQRLALARRNRLELYELATMQRVLRFEAEHAVKQCTLAFAGKHLGVLTDLGCISLYALD